jgi:hypothetical protein
VTWSTDALWLGPAIAARLRACMPALRAAEVLDDLTPEIYPQQLPAAVAILQALRPAAGTDGRVPVALVEADWLAVVVVDSRSASRDAQRQAAGPLLSQLVAALHGWTPPGCNRPMAWVPGAPRPYFTRSFSAYPLLLRTAFTTRSEPGLPALT